MKLTLKSLSKRINSIAGESIEKTIDACREACESYLNNREPTIRQMKENAESNHRSFQDKIEALEKKHAELELDTIFFLDQIINRKIITCEYCGKKYVESMAEKYFKHVEIQNGGIYLRDTKPWSETSYKICPECTKLDTWKLYKRFVEEKRNDKEK